LFSFVFSPFLFFCAGSWWRNDDNQRSWRLFPFLQAEFFDDCFGREDPDDAKSPAEADFNSRPDAELEFAAADTQRSNVGQQEGAGLESHPSHDGSATAASPEVTQSASEVNRRGGWNAGKRQVRCRRAEKRSAGKRRRRSPHPTGVYRLSLAPAPRSAARGALWQPWNDPPPPTDGPTSNSVQTALENLRRLSVMTGAGCGTSATGSAASFGDRMTSSAPLADEGTCCIAVLSHAVGNSDMGIIPTHQKQNAKS